MPALPLWVLDTNVVLDWLLFADPAVRVMGEHIVDGRARVISRADCRAELERVLEYPKLPATPRQRQAILVTYDALTCPFEGPAKDTWIPRCRDADDQKFLELARDAGAHWLVTKDNLLLRLARQTSEQSLFSILHPKAADVLLGTRLKQVLPLG